MKRAFDIACSLLGLALIAPLMVLAGMLILVFDGTHVFFVQERLGLNRDKFPLYKFRTMKNGSITPTGKWLRVAAIDELPQLVNVLKGEMSLVGPRPLTEDDVDRLGWDDPGYDARWSVRPGMAGLAQMSPVCDAGLSWRLDRFYIENQTVLLDLKIITMTLAMIVQGRKSVEKRLWRLSRIESPG